MTIQSDMALLAAGSYWDVRKSDETFDNHAPLPEGWRVLTDYDTSNTGGVVLLRSGFSARVYQNTSTSEIVISYAGTEFGLNRAGFWNDFVSGNVPLAFGNYGEQAYQAALLYQRVKADLGGNISFTGHSLGGGLASVMAVWFDRPAYVFAPAPFEKSADSTQPTHFLAEYLRAGVMPTVKRKLGSDVDPALASYDPDTQYAAREANVQAWAIQGEVLEAQLTRFSPLFVRWIEGSHSTLFKDSPTEASEGDKHSIDLHAAALLVPNFEVQAGKLHSALPLLYSKAFYGPDMLGNQQHIMTKLLRNEVGVRADDGAVLVNANGMLTSFAKDLGKLGTNIAGLNRQAQDALIAQGIEWYYWQDINYAGQEFFTVTGELLQYATAKGAGLTLTANKADIFARPWLLAIAAEHGLGTTAFPSFGTAYDQWNVAVGGSGVTAVAKDAGKSQIFLGQAGGDTFTGGNNSDVIFAGAGADTLNGGQGNDQLYGGAGTDTYQFTSTWGNDTITDSDGDGSIEIDGQALGTFKGTGIREGYAFDLGGGQYAGLAVYKDPSATTGYKALILKGTDSANTITINNFDLSKAQGEGYLGIKIDSGIKIALLGQPGNFWADPNASTSSLAGAARTFTEGGGTSFTISLDSGAKAGDNLTLSLSGLSGKGLKVLVNGQKMDAEGATIPLSLGQTQVSINLVQEGELSADAEGSLSVTFNGNERTATSNTWALTLKDAGEADNTINGDIVARTETNEGEPITRPRQGTTPYVAVKTDELYFITDASGNLVAGTTEPTQRPIYNEDNEIIGFEQIPSDDLQVIDNTLYGSAGNDKINGGMGDDLIQGGAGNDTIRITVVGGDGSTASVVTGAQTISLSSPVTLNLSLTGLFHAILFCVLAAFFHSTQAKEAESWGWVQYKGAGFVLCDQLLTELRLHQYPDPSIEANACAWSVVENFKNLTEPPWLELDPRKYENLLFELDRFVLLGSKNYFSGVKDKTDQNYAPRRTENMSRIWVKNFINQGGKIRIWKTPLFENYRHLNENKKIKYQLNILQLSSPVRASEDLGLDKCQELPKVYQSNWTMLVDENLTGPDPRLDPLAEYSGLKELSQGMIKLFSGIPHRLVGSGVTIYVHNLERIAYDGSDEFCRLVYTPKNLQGK